MVELNASGDSLLFRFPMVHPGAVLRVKFKRTLRIPDDGRRHVLPPGIGNFPMRLLDDFPSRLPDAWQRNGGVMLPMYRSEALWIQFGSVMVDGREQYPFAVKVSTGKVNALSGRPMCKGLNIDPQDYAVVPEQPWLDGYCVEKGTIRQFVAMPPGDGYSAEEQLTGRADFGGLQLLVYPMKRKAFEHRFPKPEPVASGKPGEFQYDLGVPLPCSSVPSMGMSPGGRMRQDVYRDPYEPDEWELEHYSHCFVHLADSEAWREITGKQPPYPPMTAAEYARHGLPWFDYYAEEGRQAVDGSPALAGLKSVKEVGMAKGKEPLPENESVDQVLVRNVGRCARMVREAWSKRPEWLPDGDRPRWRKTRYGGSAEELLGPAVRADGQQESLLTTRQRRRR